MILPDSCRSACATALLVGLVFGAGTAVAGEPNAALAQSLFDEARVLLDADRFDEACPKFEESQALDPAPGTLLNLAVCHEGQGKLATAWGQFLEVRAQARRDGRSDRETIANEHLAGLEPRIPKLTIQVPEASRVAGLELTLGGTKLGPPSWNTEVPVDPGPIRIVARARDRQDHVTTVHCVEGKRCSVSIPVLEYLAKTPEPTPTATTATTATPLQEPPSMARRNAGYVAAGVGLLGIGVGSYFGLRARSKWNEANDHCPNDVCDAEGSSLSHTALTSARISNVGFGIGLLGLGVAGYLVFAGPSSPSLDTEGQVGIVPGGANVSASMSW